MSNSELAVLVGLGQLVCLGLLIWLGSSRARPLAHTLRATHQPKSFHEIYECALSVNADLGKYFP
jgi:hypothetical protein